MDMDAILDAAFRRVFGASVTAPTPEGRDTTPRTERRKLEAMADALRALAANGATISEACAVMNCHKITARRLANMHGFKFRDGRSKRA